MKQEKHKALWLAIILVLGVSLLPTPSLAQKSPVTKNGMRKALRNRALSAKAIIEEIESSGVNFHLDSADKIEFRRIGKRLEQKGLDDIFAAIDRNYRPDVAQQPTATPTPAPKPNVIPVGLGKPPLIYDPDKRTFGEGFADSKLVAVAVTFRNAHEQGKELSEAKDIRAHIGYEPFEFYEKLGKGQNVKEAENSTKGFTSVDDGIWLDEAQPVVSFARGETKTLILAVKFPDGSVATFSHPIEQRAGTSAPFPRLRPLIADKFVVKVEITGGEHGEIDELYHFTITLRPEFTISYG
jgi:hypothetical protein